MFVGNGQQSFQAEKASPNTYTVQIPTEKLGTQIMAVYNGRFQLSNSPFRYEVSLPSCNEFPGKVSDVSGQCVCPSNLQASIGGTCVAYETILPAVIVPVFVFFAVLAAAYFFRQAAKKAQLWQIKENDVSMSDPPEILGTGSSGSVYRADFRGTPVAIKRFLRTNELLAQQQKQRYLGAPLTRSVESELVFDNNSGFSAINPNLSNGTERKNNRKMIKFLVSIRHPRITTVMGGVVNGGKMCLVLELMELGSLWDCLHNVLFPLDGELALNFLLSVSKGMNFLHAARPPIRHGDLKSGTILFTS